MFACQSVCYIKTTVFLVVSQNTLSKNKKADLWEKLQRGQRWRWKRYRVQKLSGWRWTSQPYTEFCIILLYMKDTKEVITQKEVCESITVTQRHCGKRFVLRWDRIELILETDSKLYVQCCPHRKTASAQWSMELLASCCGATFHQQGLDILLKWKEEWMVQISWSYCMRINVSLLKKTKNLSVIHMRPNEHWR